MRHPRFTLYLALLLWSSAGLYAQSTPVCTDWDAQLHYARLGHHCPPADLFTLGYQGLRSMQAADSVGPEALLVLIDFRLPSTAPRLWVIDLMQDSVLHNTWTSHGKHSGDSLWARQFSNTEGSLQSSIGFYRTAETYAGMHGHSMRLDGMDMGYNDQARKRYIVMHKASYVGPAFIQKHGHGGRSWGCPAIPEAGHRALINRIAHGHCLFIYYPDAQWQCSSRWLPQATAE